MHTIAYLLGLTNASGSWYLWWSGIFGDVTIFAALGIFLVHRNCHTKGCLRLGKHTVDGTGYIVCRKHHPDFAGAGKATLEQIHAAHHQARKHHGSLHGEESAMPADQGLTEIPQQKS